MKIVIIVAGPMKSKTMPEEDKLKEKLENAGMPDDIHKVLKFDTFWCSKLFITKSLYLRLFVC